MLRHRAAFHPVRRLYARCLALSMRAHSNIKDAINDSASRAANIPMPAVVEARVPAERSHPLPQVRYIIRALMRCQLTERTDPPRSRSSYPPRKGQRRRFDRYTRDYDIESRRRSGVSLVGHRFILIVGGRACQYFSIVCIRMHTRMSSHWQMSGQGSNSRNAEHCTTEAAALRIQDKKSS